MTPAIRLVVRITEKKRRTLFLSYAAYHARRIDTLPAPLYRRCMFLWRWFKRMVTLVMMAAILYAASGYINIHGKPARTYVEGFLKSELWQEGTKDMRTWLAAVLRGASTKIEEGVTPQEQKKLDQLIESDLGKQIETVKKP